MAVDQTIFSADFGAVATDFGVTFAWSQTQAEGGLASSGLTGVIGDLETSDKTTDAGFLVEFDLVLFADISNFSGAVPARGGGITITDYGAYQIEKTIVTQGDPIVRLGLMSVNK